MLVPVPSSGCYLLDGGEVSAFVLFRASPPQSPQHRLSPVHCCPGSRCFDTAGRATQLLCGS